MKTEVMKLPKTFKFIGIELKAEELELIKLIYDLKIINTRNVHIFFKAHSKKPKSKQVISNRINKLINAGIFYRLDDSHISSLEFRPTNFYLRLSVRGLGILRKEGMITEHEFEYAKTAIYAIKIPQPHNEAVNRLVLDIYLKALFNGTSLHSSQVKLNRGEYSLPILEAGTRMKEGEIIPDFVFESNTHFTCLELDSGNQMLSVLNTKIIRYKELAEELNKPVTLIFSVGLGDFNGARNSSRDRRVNSIKELFPYVDELPKGLEVYVIETSRATDLIYNQILKKQQLVERHRKGRILEWLVKSMEAAPSGTIFTQSRNPAFERIMLEDSFDLDVPGEITFPNQETKLVAFLYMEECSIRSFQRARANIQRVEEANVLIRGDEKPFSLFLIYEKEENIANDVIGIVPKCDVWMISIEKVLAAARNRENEYPSILKINSQFTKIEGKLV